jgi:hypothetical protein
LLVLTLAEVAMIIVALALGAGIVLMALMVAIYRYGDRVIPAGALVPVHGGPGGWDRWRPKKSGLRTWPIGGAVVSVILVAAVCVVEYAGNSGGQHRGTAAAAITMGAWVLVIVILPLFQYRAIRAALRRLDAQGSRR